MNILIYGMKHAIDDFLVIIKALLKRTNTYYNIHYYYNACKYNNTNTIYDNNIFICYNFFDVYPIIKQFDEIIYILQDIRLISHNTKDMLKLLELHQCCSIFASYTIPYEKMKYIDIFNVCKLMKMYIPYEDIPKCIKLSTITYNVPIKIKNNDICVFLGKYGFTEQYDKTVFTLS